MARKTNTKLLPAFFGAFLLGILVMPTFVFLAVAMLPTLVAIMMGNASRGYKWVCIMGGNLAGTFPFLFDLWIGVHDMESVFSIVFNVTNMIVIYGSAFLGWLLYILIPPIIVTIISISDQNKVKGLKKKQELLIQQWGQNVKNNQQ